MPFGWAAGAAAVGSIGSSLISSGASKDASKAASQASMYAAQLQQAQFADTAKRLDPFREAGANAVARQGDYINNAQNEMANAYQKSQDYMPTYQMQLPNFGETIPTQQLNLPNQQSVTAGDLPTTDALNAAVPTQYVPNMPHQMTQAELEATPGYQFNLEQGLRATQNAAAAHGLGVSGAALQGAAKYAVGLADSTYQNQFNNQQALFANQNQIFNARNQVFNDQNTAFNAANQVFADKGTMYNQAFNQGQQNFTDQNQIYQNQFNVANQKNNLQQINYSDQQKLFDNQQAQFTDASTLFSNKNNSLITPWNMINQMATLGSNAASQTATQGTALANQAGTGIQSAGNATANGINAQGAAESSGINGIAKAFGSYANQYQANNPNGSLSSAFSNFFSPSSGGDGFQSGLFGTGVGGYNSAGANSLQSLGLYNPVS